jgi:hypothetical protein
MGTFTIDKVPPGTYMLQAWHERFGMQTKPVTVKAGGVVTVDFTYTGNEKPSASLRELTVPLG